MLWWRIVGVTEQIIHEKIDIEECNYEVTTCNNEVSRLVPNQLQVEQDEEHKEDNKKDLFKLSFQTHNREVGHIKAEPDLKFMLVRLWTLFDSINNSNYMVTKLGLWKEDGQKRFREFLVEIGCSLDQAKQKFNFMDPELRKSLIERIMNKVEKFDLQDIIMNSYVR